LIGVTFFTGAGDVFTPVVVVFFTGVGLLFTPLFELELTFFTVEAFTGVGEFFGGVTAGVTPTGSLGVD